MQITPQKIGKEEYRMKWNGKWNGKQREQPENNKNFKNPNISVNKYIKYKWSKFTPLIIKSKKGQNRFFK